MLANKVRLGSHHKKVVSSLKWKEESPKEMEKIDDECLKDMSSKELSLLKDKILQELKDRK